MRIYRMTATFGKLEHQTLEVKPGLNILTAPNEWGKSTWCAFLVAMLYGIDTRAKSTKHTLADKERYAPWSGSPMSGRIDLNWQGRDITIERNTTRRVPMGEFKAYETASGLPVKELTAENCGQLLLGVEQSVFRRAGFIRHADLPVTQDEALRRRLNALVTTGDDSGAADRLAAELKELKNRVRYNRSGLLPQAEAQRTELEGKLTELETLNAQTEKLANQLAEIKVWLEQLDNHRQALAYGKMQADLARVAQARETLEGAEQTLLALEAACAQLPSREAAEQKTRELRSFRQQWNDIQQELLQVPAEPQQPELPAPFTGMDAEAAWTMAWKDAKAYAEMTKTKAPVVLMVVGVFGVLAAAGLAFLLAYVFAAISGLAGAAAFLWGIYEKRSMKKQTKGLLEKYGNGNWKHWTDPVEDYTQAVVRYEKAQKEYRDIISDLEVRLMVLRKKRDTLCGEETVDAVLEYWEDALEKWEACLAARRETRQAGDHLDALSAMVKPVEKPTMPDHLTQSEAETARLQAECSAEQQRLQNRLGQYQGRMALLGNREQLSVQLDKVNVRIQRLEDTYGALVIAQETLAEAREELQRRFAPRITRRAQKLLARMTGGRYTDLTMDTEFSLQAGTGEEDILREALWRSDGTMDQLYLALRLAVAEELTPGTPLVLDDVLVRFDDERMKAAVLLLKEMAKDRQILCFTCQGREKTV
ncbi:MAG: AAA family ATPase [Oscillospiraceae bacterium]|nr:AAA family ATPase [Oscillospiraceae bacterium]